MQLIIILRLKKTTITVAFSKNTFFKQYKMNNSFFKIQLNCPFKKVSCSDSKAREKFWISTMELISTWPVAHVLPVRQSERRRLWAVRQWEAPAVERHFWQLMRDRAEVACLSVQKSF